MSDLVIRAAVAGDLDGILELERAIPEAPHWSKGDYRATLEGAEKRCVLVAEMEGQLAGFAVVAVAVDVGQLESIAVAAHERRQGVGSALCNAVVEWCRGHGARSMQLEVRAGGAGAIALYEGLGFRATGRRRGYYREPAEDALLMEMELRD
jgi:[ribosomal protein S18]-alanine N-acetyltransferase